MHYRVIVPKPVRKRIEALPNHIRSRVLADVSGLENDPRPPDCLKLKGVEGEYRIRIGDYRVRYSIHDDSATVVLIDCRHRKDVYRGR
jgi:mRNA interferase RelE/StbE